MPSSSAAPMISGMAFSSMLSILLAGSEMVCRSNASSAMIETMMTMIA